MQCNAIPALLEKRSSLKILDIVEIVVLENLCRRILLRI